MWGVMVSFVVMVTVDVAVAVSVVTGGNLVRSSARAIINSRAGGGLAFSKYDPKMGIYTVYRYCIYYALQCIKRVSGHTSR